MSASSSRARHQHSSPIAHEVVDPYEERDYRKRDARVRANPLLVKVQTGKVKPTTYNLPPDGFTYGRRDGFEEDGVKGVVNSWAVHQAPRPAAAGRDFVTLNRSAVVRGAVSSKDITAFRGTHDARLQKSQTITKAPPLRLPADATFGRPSMPSTPIHDVLSNAYQRNAIVAARRAQEEAEARRLAMEQSKAGRFGQSQHTRASLGHLKIAAPPAAEPFKLARFKNVGPRIGYQGKDTLSIHHTQQQRQQQQAQQTQQQQQQEHEQTQVQQAQAQQAPQQSYEQQGEYQFQEEKTADGEILTL